MKSLSIVLLASIGIMAGCKKEDTKTTSVVNDNTIANYYVFDLLDIGAEAASKNLQVEKDSDQVSSYFINCAAMYRVPAFPDTTYPRTITADFGSGCVGNDGRLRSGKVVVTLFERWQKETAHYSVATENYTVDGFFIEMEMEVNKDGRNSEGSIESTVTVSDGKIIATSGDSVTFENTTTIAWKEGEYTSYFTAGVDGVTDDVFTIEGSGSGIATDGVAYKYSITKALWKQIGCKWIKLGTIDFNPDGFVKQTVDFGDGQCDNYATVTIGKSTNQINLP